jgi:signal transduction histidine kinase
LPVLSSLKFRQRIGLLVALAGVALVILALVTVVLGRRNERELLGIETRYVPLIELDRDLARLATETAKALEDAAAAAEESKLADADRTKAELVARIETGAAEITDNGGDPRALAAAFAAYYDKARAVSAALVAGTSPASLDVEIQAMARARTAFDVLRETSASPDRARLAAAFASARATYRESLIIDIAVASIALLVMGLLSWMIVRNATRSLTAVAQGVERIAQGELERPIEISSDDEFGALAREANRTAERLREYREQERALLVEAQRQTHAAQTAANELEAFSYSVSHDLRAPLRAIDGFSQALVEDEGDRLSPKGVDYLRRIRAGAQRMAELIDDMLRLSRVSRAEFKKERVDLSQIASAVMAELRRNDPDREVTVTIADNIIASADARLIKITFENLLGNAWKFTAKTAAPTIEVGVEEENGEPVYFVRDNGAGFDMKYADALFGAFRRLHTDKEFPGTGIGLATVQRIIHRHGGRIWGEGSVGNGAWFRFTLPA